MSILDTYVVKKRKKFAPGNKIYISLSSEGLGHSSRGLAIAKEFKKEDVVIGAYNYALERFKNEGYNAVDLPQEFKLVGTAGAFDVGKTLLKNQYQPLTFNKIIAKEVDVIRENGVSCVIADGRLAPVLAADKLSLPCLVITNQSAFYPFFEKNSPLIRIFGKSFDWVMKTCLSSSEEIIIPDFPPPYTVCLYNLSKNFKVMKRTRFVGPLVRFDADKLDKINKPAEKYVAVTLGGHAYRRPILDNVIQVARELPDYFFDIFTNFVVDDIPENVRVQTFINDISPYLNTADMIITQAGHSTAMELLTLGKPSLIIPDFKQIEQENNARRMEELGTSIKLEYRELSAKSLQDAILKLTTDEKYTEKSLEFKKLAAEINGRKNVAEVINEYAKRLQYY